MSALPHLGPAVHPAHPAQPHSGRPLAASAWACLRRQPARAHPERGVVLLVALVMLLLVTVLGLTSARMLTMEERMAANSFDRNLAFQAAETALREGEALAELQLLAASGPNAGADWINATSAISPLATGVPQFFVEHLGSNFPCDPQNPTPLSSTCERYRITARSHDPAAPATQGRANVVLQSIYAGLGSWAAANPPTQFIPETFAPTEAAQRAGKDLSGLDSSQNGADTENHKNDDSGYADEESAEGESAINVNVVRGRISWREIIPR